MEEKTIITMEKNNVKRLFVVFLIIGLIFTIVQICASFAEEYDYRYYRAKETYNSHTHDMECMTEDYKDFVAECESKYRTVYESYKKVFANFDKTFEEFVLEKELGSLTEEEKHETLKDYVDCLYSKYATADKYAKKFVWDKFDASFIFVSLIPVAAFAVLGGVICLWLYYRELTVTNKRVIYKRIFGIRTVLPVGSVTAVNRSIFRFLSVSTSSGKIRLFSVKNIEAIYDEINNLIVER